MRQPIPGETGGKVLRTSTPCLDLGEPGFWRAQQQGPGQATVAQFPELLRARRGSLCFLKISKQLLTTRSLQPPRRQSFTLCRTIHSQPDPRSRALGHFYNTTFCLIPIPLRAYCAPVLSTPTSAKRPNYRQPGKEWTLSGPPAPLTRLSQPHRPFILTVLQYRSSTPITILLRPPHVLAITQLSLTNSPLLIEPTLDPTIPTSQPHTPCS